MIVSEGGASEKKPANMNENQIPSFQFYFSLFHGFPCFVDFQTFAELFTANELLSRTELDSSIKRMIYFRV